MERSFKRWLAMLLAVLMAFTAINWGSFGFAAENLKDSDGDGIPDVLEGYCPTAELFEATAGYNWTYDAEFAKATPATGQVVTINPTGGNDFESLRIMADRAGREQTFFGGKANYYNPATGFNGTGSSNNTGFILHINGKPYFSEGSFTNTIRQRQGIYNVEVTQRLQGLKIYDPIGSGTEADPWRIQAQYYADLNGQSGYQADGDVLVKQIYTYVAGDKYFRRDFAVVVGPNVPVSNTNPIKVYEWRDYFMMAETDSGFGQYVTGTQETGIQIHTGTGGITGVTGREVAEDNAPTINPADTRLVGVLQRKANVALEDSLFTGFWAISPFKAVSADKYNAYMDTSVASTRWINKRPVMGGDLNNVIVTSNTDIGTTIQHSDITSPGTTAEYSGFTVFNKGTMCTAHRDTDKDGVPDYQDLDSDNDKIPDVIEAGLVEDPANPGKLNPGSLQSKVNSAGTAVTTVDTVGPTGVIVAKAGTPATTIIGTTIEVGKGESLPLVLKATDATRQSISVGVSGDPAGVTLGQVYTSTGKTEKIVGGKYVTDHEGTFAVVAPTAPGTYTVTVDVIDNAGVGNAIAAPTQIPGNKTQVTFTLKVLDITPAPTINPVGDKDNTITGTGVPGATVWVTHNGVDLGSVTVDGDGNWSIDAPIAPQMNPDDTITAKQQETGKAISTEAATTVIPSVIADPIGDPQEGYVRVSFTTDPIMGFLDGHQVYDVKVGTQAKHIAAPIIKSNPGYEVATPEWDPIYFDSEQEIKDNAEFTAQYNQLQAPTPTINTVGDKDVVVKGTITDPNLNFEGAEVIVTFPGGATATGTIVNGKWEVEVPAGVTLTVGEDITAVVTFPNFKDSEPGTTKVIESVIYIDDPENTPPALGYVRGTFNADTGGNLSYGGNTRKTFVFDAIPGTLFKFIPVPTPVADTDFQFTLWDPVLKDPDYAIRQDGAYTAKFIVTGQTDTPVLNPIGTLDTTITGKAVAGATVTDKITTPDGTTTADIPTAAITTDVDGNVTIDVAQLPAAFLVDGKLPVNTKVEIYAQEGVKLISAPAAQLVKENILPVVDPDNTNTPSGYVRMIFSNGVNGNYDPTTIIHTFDVKLGTPATAVSTMVNDDLVPKIVPNTGWALNEEATRWNPGLPTAAIVATDGKTYTAQYTQGVSADPVITEPIEAGATTVSGTGVAGATIVLTLPSGSTRTVVVDDEGNWTITGIAPLAHDAVLKATQQETGKKLSGEVSATVKDTTSPIITEKTATVPSGQPITPISVVVTDASPVTITVDADTLPPGLTYNTTTKQIEGTPTEPGIYEVKIDATDIAGNQATQVIYTVTVEDKTPPQPPTVQGPISEGDTSVVVTPSEPGGTIELFKQIKGSTVIVSLGTVTVGANTGPITITDLASTLSEGDIVYARQIDEANNKSEKSNEVVVLANIIPIEDPATETPQGYVRITFEGGTNGAIAGGETRIFDVKVGTTFPANKAPQILANPGFDFKAWNPALPMEITEATTFTAQYTQQVSAPPVINQPKTGDTSISGTGIPGSTINGTADGTPFTATVNAAGTWTATVAAMEVGKTVTATQTEPNKAVSTSVDAIVRDKIIPVGPDNETNPENSLYAKVTFVSGDHGDFEATPTNVDEKAYWVLKDNTVKVGEVFTFAGLSTTAGTGIAVNEGHNFKGWFPPADAEETITGDKIFKVEYQKVSAPPNINDIYDGDTTVTGTGIPGSTIKVTLPDGKEFDDGTSTKEVPVGNDYHWTIDVPALATGDVVKATQTEPNAVESPEASKTVITKEQSPEPIINQPLEGQKIITGSGVPGATVTVTIPGDTPQTKTATVENNGTWTVKSDTDLVAGVTITATQAVTGKTESPAATQTVKAIETSAAPEINQPTVGDTTITGTGIPGSTISVTISGVTDPVTATVGNDYKWTVDVPTGTTLAENDTITATQTEIEKKASTPVESTVKAKDLEKSTSPVIDIVGEKATTITGTGIAGSTIAVTITGVTDPVEATVDGDGKWTVNVPTGIELAVGDKITATQTENGKAVSDPAEKIVVAKSATPMITQPKVGDTAISGMGVPGATITVELPSRDKVTATVGNDYKWSADIPNIEPTLKTGDEVKATQVEPGKVVSDEATATVTDATPAPTINTAVVGDEKITGTGVAKAEVSVTVPWQNDPIKITVGDDGKWSIDVPTDEPLKVGDVIKATQTETGKLPSEEVTKTVIDKVIPITDPANPGENPDPTRFVKVTLDDGEGTFEDTVKTALWALKGIEAKDVFDAAGLKTTDATNLTAPAGKDFTQYEDPGKAKVEDDTKVPNTDVTYTATFADQGASATPEINTVVEGDREITGTGVIGAEVTVIVPWNTAGIQVTVTKDPDNPGQGIWTIPVPAGTNLVKDQEITATQKETGKVVSAPAKTTVLEKIIPVDPANPDANPDADRFVKVTLDDGEGTFADTVPAAYWVQKGETAKSVFDKAGLSTTEKTDNLTAPTNKDFNGYKDGADAAVENTTAITAESTFTAQFVDKGKSADPTINTAVVGDTTITGTGVNGAEVSVTVLWQADPVKVTVVDGKWSIDVPMATPLTADQEIKATQTEPGKLASGEVLKTVLDKVIPVDPANPDENPDATRYVKASFDANGGTFADTVKNPVWALMGIPVSEALIEAGLNLEVTKGLTAPANNDFDKYIDGAGNEVVAATVIPKFDMTYKAVYTAQGQTPAPAINTAVVGDTTITGTGVTGAEVSVTVPWQADPIVVDVVDGKWSVDVPAATPLEKDDVIKATQTETGKLPSEEVTKTVIDKVIPVDGTTPANPDTDRFVKVTLDDGDGTFADTVKTALWALKGIEAKDVFDAAGIKTSDATNLTAPAGKDFTQYEDPDKAKVEDNTKVPDTDVIYTAIFADQGASATPEINTVVEGDREITGTGVIGAEVTVIVPWNTAGIKVTVTEDPDNPGQGIWMIPVPAGTNLVKDQEITATQKETGKVVSEEVKTTVLEKIIPVDPANPDANPDADRFVKVTLSAGDGTFADTVPAAYWVLKGETAKSVFDKAGLSTTEKTDNLTAPTNKDFNGYKDGADEVVENTAAITAEATFTAQFVDKATPVEDKDKYTPVVAPEVLEVGDTYNLTDNITSFKDDTGTTVTPPGPITYKDVTPDGEIDTTKPGDYTGKLEITYADGSTEIVDVPITVNSKPEPEQSPAPSIDQPTAGETTVSGKGIPGATITVTLPDNTTKETTVKPDYTWTIDVPELKKDDVVEATQQEPNKSESNPVQVTVTEKPAPEQSKVPNIDQPTAGEKEITGTGVPGATVTVTLPDGSKEEVTVKPDGTWTVRLDQPLKKDDVVKAQQTEPNKTPSNEIQKTVTDKPATEQSKTPDIRQPYSGDNKVTGTGVPGATITVTLPNGETKTTTVDPNGNWSIDVPRLRTGDVIKATQTESGKSPSAETKKTVRSSGGGGGATPEPINPWPTTEKGDHYAYIVGYPDHKVRPDGNLTRAEAATMFAKLLAYQTGDKIASVSGTGFTDSQDTWYTDFVKYVADKGVMKGYPDGTFGPDRLITRAELATMIANYENVTPNGTPFTDIEGHWAKAFIEEVYTSGKVSGDFAPDGSRVFRPNDNIKRVEAASIFNTFFNRRVDHDGIGTLQVKRFDDLSKEYWGYAIMTEATNNHKYERKENGKIMERWISLFEGVFFHK